MAVCTTMLKYNSRGMPNIYIDTLENEVIPLYYERDKDGIPHYWIKRMKHAIQSLGWRFSADRMVRDYTERFYLPAASATSAETV